MKELFYFGSNPLGKGNKNDLQGEFKFKNGICIVSLHKMQCYNN